MPSNKTDQLNESIENPSSTSESNQSCLINTESNSQIENQRVSSSQSRYNSIPTEKLSLMTAEEQSSVVQPLLTDFYQISMAYAYWKSKKHEENAVFDLYFRKNPFGGEYTIFAGLEECLKFVENYRLHPKDIDYLRKILPDTVEESFFEYLEKLDMKDVKIYAPPEGTVMFPRVPLIRVEGPVIKAQLLETTFLTLVNYASLVATNAARFRQAAGEKKTLMEFGLRRAQGPDGGLSASKYCYLGGFDGTSNVLAGKLYDIPVSGTHAHAYVSSYSRLKDLNERNLCDGQTKESIPFADLCVDYLKKLQKLPLFSSNDTNEGELTSFISYAIAFPTQFLALVDTYDVLKSGVTNFLAVALALDQCHYKPRGIRLDSGDLAYLSVEVRKRFKQAAKDFEIPYFETLTIVASNDINEDTLVSLANQGHEINTYGIGTHLVTCQKQPALGCVYKLVQLNNEPRIKLSQDIEKVTIPGKKSVYRLYGHDDKAICDLLTKEDQLNLLEQKEILIKHPFAERQRAKVKPSRIVPLCKLYWADGKVQESLPSLKETRDYAKKQLEQLRKDHVRDLNPTPYKVSVTQELYEFMHSLWSENIPTVVLD